MEKPASFYIKAAIMMAITFIIVAYSGLKVVDYVNSEFVEARFIDGYFVYEEKNKRIRANEFENNIYEQGASVTMLYDRQTDSLSMYVNFYNYFRSFLIAFIILLVGWKMMWDERKRLNRIQQE